MVKNNFISLNIDLFNTIKISGVYIITNLLNDYVYVGSSMDLHDRMYKHLGLLKRNKHENKNIQIFYNKHRNDYNNPIELFEFNVVKLINDKNLSKVNLKKKLYYYEQLYLDNFDKKFNLCEFSDLTNKTLYQYDQQYNLIKIWKSAIVVDRETNGYYNHSAIGSCCNNNRNHYKGFIWSHIKLSKEKLTIRINKIKIDKQKQVYQYDLNSNLIQKYDNASQTIYNKSHILNCCHNKTNTHSYKGFIWSFKELTDVELKQKIYNVVKPKTKKVYQYDLNNNLIHTYEKLSSVKEYGFNISHVSSVCNGNRNKHKNFYWTFNKI